jgi:hypothetical protein
MNEHSGNMANIHKQMHTITHQVDTGFQDLRHSLDRTDERLRVIGEDLTRFKLQSAAKWEEYDKKMAELDAKYLQNKQDIDKQLQDKVRHIEDLLSKHARPAAGELATPQADAWANYRRSGLSGVGSSSQYRSSSLPPVPHDLGYDPCKVWIKGFRRPLMREKLIQHFDTIVNKLGGPPGVKHHIRGPSSLYALSFPDPDGAAAAYKTLRAQDIEWIDPTNNVTRTLKIYRDQKPEDRTAARMVSQMWEPLIELMKNKHKWVEGMRLLNSQRQMWIVDADEPYPLFRIHFKSKDEVTIITDETTRTHYGISVDEAEALKGKGLVSRGRSGM